MWKRTDAAVRSGILRNIRLRWSFLQRWRLLSVLTWMKTRWSYLQICWSADSEVPSLTTKKNIFYRQRIWHWRLSIRSGSDMISTFQAIWLLRTDSFCICRIFWNASATKQLFPMSVWLRSKRPILLCLRWAFLSAVVSRNIRAAPSRRMRSVFWRFIWVRRMTDWTSNIFIMWCWFSPTATLWQGPAAIRYWNVSGNGS